MEGVSWLVLRHRCSYTHRTSLVYWNVINNFQSIKNQRLLPTKINKTRTPKCWNRSTQHLTFTSDIKPANRYRIEFRMSLYRHRIVGPPLDTVNSLHASNCKLKSSTYILHFYLRQRVQYNVSCLKMNKKYRLNF